MESVKQVNVGGETYTIALWTADKAYEMLVRLGQTVGGALRDAVTLDLSEGSAGEKQDRILAGAAVGLLTSLSPKDSLSLFKDILRETCPQGSSKSVVDDFGIRFAGKLLHASALAKEVLIYQYGDFSDALAPFIQAAKARAKAKRGE